MGRKLGPWFKKWWSVYTVTFTVLCAVVTGTWYLSGKMRDLSHIETTLNKQNNALELLHTNLGDLNASLQTLAGLEQRSERNLGEIERLQETIAAYGGRLSALEAVTDLLEELLSGREMKYGAVEAPGEEKRYYTREELPEFIEDVVNTIEKYDSVYDVNETDTVRSFRRIRRGYWTGTIHDNQGNFIDCGGSGKGCFSFPEPAKDPDDVSTHFKIEAHFASIDE